MGHSVTGLLSRQSFPKTTTFEILEEGSSFDTINIEYTSLMCVWVSGCFVLSFYFKLAVSSEPV